MPRPELDTLDPYTTAMLARIEADMEADRLCVFGLVRVMLGCGACGVGIALLLASRWFIG